ncbi:MAG: hypothetical protein ACLVEJ_16950 [Parabacteroides sp.]
MKGTKIKTKKRNKAYEDRTTDVDGHHFPNFALMKLAAWHKSKGDSVGWTDAMFGSGYDRVYKSKIFTFSRRMTTHLGTARS